MRGELTTQCCRSGLRAAEVTPDAGNGRTYAAGGDVLDELHQVGIGRFGYR